MERITRRDFCRFGAGGLAGGAAALAAAVEGAMGQPTRKQPRTRRGILNLRLQTGRLAEVRAFYRDLFHFPIRAETEDTVCFQAGSTSITFVRNPAPESHPFYHFAFNIPENMLPLAQKWLAERTPLITRESGPVFHFPHWNAHAIYFWDPAGNIGELIARHDLRNARSGAFSADDILYASEIGLVVKDVPTAVRDLKARLALPTYRGGSEVFEPLGDEHRLLIVVREGRQWFGAENGKPAAIFPTVATLDGSRAGTCKPTGHPYTVAVEPSA